MTERETLQAAFAALLRGDTAERDRLIDPLIAKRREEQHQRARAFNGNGQPILVKQHDGRTIEFRTLPRTDGAE